MPDVELILPHHRYDIRIEPGALAALGPLLREVAPHDQTALIVDERIAASYGQQAQRSLADAGYEVTTAIMPEGETHKTLDTVRKLYDALLDARLERKSPVVALGGGITGDTAGFVAATYLRGVPFVQCPTTLLAMVDASVGGKVGVNVPQGKNLIGAFHQPTRVIIDPTTLATLPPRELRCGLAECVKHGMIRDADLFAWLEEHVSELLTLDTPEQTPEIDALVTLIERNVRIKAAVVMEDEKEAGVRAHLNLGHTFAHAIEAQAGYGRFHHGEAVALGLVAATWVSVQQRLCEPGMLERVTALLDAIGLPTRASDLPGNGKLIAAMRSDKKVAHSRIRLVLPVGLGAAAMRDDVHESLITEAWDHLRG